MFVVVSIGVKEKTRALTFDLCSRYCHTTRAQRA